MDNEQIRHKVTFIFNEVFKENIDLNDSTSADDIKSWDSLNHIILLKKIEEVFQIEIDLFDMIELRNAGDIIHYIQNKI